MASLSSCVTLTVGLVSISVDVHSASRTERTASTVSLCANGHDPVPVKLTPVCPECGIADKALLLRGVKDGNGWLTTSAEEVNLQVAELAAQFKSMKCSVSAETQVLEHVAAGSKRYWLVPTAKSRSQDSGPYQTLVQTLAAHPEVAVMCKFAIRTAVTLYRLEARDDRLMLVEYVPAAQLVAAPVIGPGDVDPADVKFAEQMLTSLVGPFDPALPERPGLVVPDQIPTADPLAAMRELMTKQVVEEAVPVKPVRKRTPRAKKPVDA
jgi:Ku70/Ku80 beta-barrel domain